MVAKVKCGKNIAGALKYNEMKVHEGTARCIFSSKFGLDGGELSFNQKLRRFKILNDNNLKVKTNTVHVSLNFDTSETVAEDTLLKISQAYMDKIGFGDQPYLVYQHYDAAHSHIHIVTTNVQENGKRINLHNIGKNQSEKARKELEQEFNLIKAESRHKIDKEFVFPIRIKKAVYGKTETKRAISNIVHQVTTSYKYTSLPELNAVLNQFNVTADRGIEGSKMFEKKGLVYTLLNDKGEKVGVPIKASSIYGRPTLAFLERQFRLNEVLKRPHALQLKSTIDNILEKHKNISRASFSDTLSKRGINVIFRDNKDGRTYGVTFVDHNTKVVFKGSDLGKGYSATNILEKLSGNPLLSSNSGIEKVNVETVTSSQPQENKVQTGRKFDPGVVQIIKDITTPQSDYTSLNELLKKRRKKKRKGYRL
jgi:hypothetical protein